jgi:hypothetical protein
LKEIYKCTKDKAQAISLLIMAVKEADQANSRGIKVFDDPGQQHWIDCAKVIISCMNNCCDIDQKSSW